MFTDDYKRRIADHFFGGPPMTAPLSLYMGLHVGGTAPSLVGAGSGFVEPSGGAYARVEIPNDDEFWTEAEIAATGPHAGHAVKTNLQDVLFPEATAEWGTPTHVGLFTASSSGILIAAMPIGAGGGQIAAGGQARIAAGRLTFVTRRF